MMLLNQSRSVCAPFRKAIVTKSRENFRATRFPDTKAEALGTQSSFIDELKWICHSLASSLLEITGKL